MILYGTEWFFMVFDITVWYVHYVMHSIAWYCFVGIYFSSFIMVYYVYYVMHSMAWYYWYCMYFIYFMDYGIFIIFIMVFFTHNALNVEDVNFKCVMVRF